MDLLFIGRLIVVAVMLLFLVRAQTRKQWTEAIFWAILVIPIIQAVKSGG